MGELQEIQLRRTAATTDWLAILGQLAVDVELLLDLAGPINRVTAFSPQQSKGPVRNLLVTMGGETDVVLQWTYQAGEEAAAQLQIHGQGGQRTEELARTPSPGEIAVAIERLLSSKKATDRFLRACRAMEIAEAAGESLRRGRTVQLYEQQRSEQQSFKGIMAAGGCLVLLGVLAMLGASVAIDGLGGGLRENAWWRLWPLCLLTPVVLFLALQVLWRVFPRS